MTTAVKCMALAVAGALSYTGYNYLTDGKKKQVVDTQLEESAKVLQGKLEPAIEAVKQAVQFGEQAEKSPLVAADVTTREVAGVVISGQELVDNSAQNQIVEEASASVAQRLDAAHERLIGLSDIGDEKTSPAKEFKPVSAEQRAQLEARRQKVLQKQMNVIDDLLR